MRSFAWERPCPDPHRVNSCFLAQGQPTTGTLAAAWHDHLEDVTLAHFDSWTYGPNKEEVSVEGSEDNLPADQNRKGEFGPPRVELRHEKHTYNGEAVQVGGNQSGSRLVVSPPVEDPPSSIQSTTHESNGIDRWTI